MNKAIRIVDLEYTRPLSAVKVLSNGQIFFSDDDGYVSISTTEGSCVVFEHQDFERKIYQSSALPERVKLLKRKFHLYQDRLFYFPQQEVKVYLHAPYAYRAKIFRYGLQRELILDLGEFPAKSQCVPDGDVVESGLMWESNFSYKLDHGLHSGLYALLVEDLHGHEELVPFVLCPKTEGAVRPKKILVVANTFTWQCYNSWGGRSRYVNFEEGLSSFTVQDNLAYQPSLKGWLKERSFEILPKRFIKKIKKFKKKIHKKEAKYKWYLKKLSAQRCFTAHGLKGEDPNQHFLNHLCAGEWRVLAWLEREGIEYEVMADAALDQNLDCFSDYALLVLSTHAEYWTKNMLDALQKAHHHQGLSILNLSGNSLYREVMPYTDGPIRYCGGEFKTSHYDETQLLGVSLNPKTVGSAAPYRVIDAKNFVFRHLNLKRGELFGKNCLNGYQQRSAEDAYDAGGLGSLASLHGSGGSGLETDCINRNTPDDFSVVAKGENPGGGADMVVKTPKGKCGGSFSASSIFFGGSLLVDPLCSQIVKNVLHEFLAHEDHRDNDCNLHEEVGPYAQV